MGLLSSCWDGSAWGGGRGGQGDASWRERPFISRDSPDYLFIYLSVSQAGRCGRPLSLAAVQVPLPAMSCPRQEGGKGGSGKPPPREAPSATRLRPQLGFWAREPESAGLASPRGQWGHRSCPSQPGTSCCHGNHGKGVVRHEDTAAASILLPRGPADTEAGEGASHATGSYPTLPQRCVSHG